MIKLNGSHQVYQKFCQKLFLGSYLSTAAEEIGADNFFAREQRLDLENEFSGEPYEQKSESNRKTQIENDLDEETTEDPALVEKVD